jgi:hypothetical protein
MTKILIFLKSDLCSFCNMIYSKIDDIIDALKKNDENITIKIINVTKKTFDTTKYPIALHDYLIWLPMFLYMDMNTWEYLKTKNNIDDYLKQNIKVLNGVWVENTLEYRPTITIKTKTSEKLTNWLNANN